MVVSAWFRVKGLACAHRFQDGKSLCGSHSMDSVVEGKIDSKNGKCGICKRQLYAALASDNDYMRKHWQDMGLPDTITEYHV